MHTDWAPKKLAEIIGELQQAHDYTRDDLGKRANVHRSQISRWVGGHHRPGYEAVRNLVRTVHDEHPDDATTALLGRLARAAGYPDLAYGEDERYRVTRRRIESQAGDLVAHLVTDLEADTDGMSEEDAEEMVSAVLERVKRQAEIFAEEERVRLARRRRRAGEGNTE